MYLRNSFFSDSKQIVYHFHNIKNIRIVKYTTNMVGITNTNDS